MAAAVHTRVLTHPPPAAHNGRSGYRGPGRHLSYLHAMASGHAPGAVQIWEQAGPWAHSLTPRLQLEIREAFRDSCPFFHMLLIH